MQRVVRTPIGASRIPGTGPRPPGARLMGVVAAAVLTVLPGGPVRAASITQATPQGEVARVQQIVLKFDAPVVELGSSRLPDPASVRCEGPVPPGTGQWVTAQHWTYDFQRALPPGVACTISVRPDWKPREGSLGGRTSFSFQTGGPSVEQISPAEGAPVEEDQHFLVRFNGPAVDASVTAASWCEVEGIGERVPVRLVGGAAREAVLKAQGLTAAGAAARTLLLSCQRPLPPEARLRLVFGPGIAAQALPRAVTRSPRAFEYTVRRAFSAEFSCERERAQAPCLPIRPLLLRLSEAVPRTLAQQVRLKPASGSGAALAPVFDKDDRSTEVSELRFPVPLAENARYQIELPRDFKDASGRPLANAASFPLAVATGEAPPIAKFAAAPFGILERLAEPVLPLTVRHVQGDLRPAAAGGQVRVLTVSDPLAMLKTYAQVLKLHERQISARDAGLPRDRWTERVKDRDSRGREVQREVERWVGTREVSMLRTQKDARRMDLPALQGGDPRPFEVVGIPLPQPGLHVVEIESGKLGAALLEQPAGATTAAPMYVRTAVLVTNLAVHVKLARDGGLAWVTTLDRAQPVAGAQVAVHDCQGQPLWSGRTDAQGRARIEAALAVPKGDCLADSGFFVSAVHGAPGAPGTAPDVAFTFTSWNKGIDPWRFNLPLAGTRSAPVVRAHSVLDRTLLRAGETVSMKHYVRTETARGLALPTPEALPARVRITHEGSGQELTVPVQWKGTRSGTSSWTIPAAARLGNYRVTLERDGAPPGEPRTLDSASFRVEEFRLPLVDARIVPPKTAVVAPAELALDVQMAYTAGGAMAQAALRGTAQWRERTLDFPAWPEFSFQPPRSTAEVAAARPAGGEEADESPASPARLVADKVPLTTDRDGAARWVIPLPALAPPQPAGQRPGELRAELSYADPNGEVQTVSTRVPTWPAAVVAGVRAGAWASRRGSVSVTALALDVEGRALKGRRIEVRGRVLQTLSTRQRLVGGFYAYDNRTEVRELGVLCSGSTDERGLLPCDATLDSAGEVELIVQAKDDAGRVSEAATSVWITGQGELWFTQDNDDRIDVLPEKKRYEPGETARLQVRMPFREATALVAIEREGLIDTRIVTLRGGDPTVEVPIEAGWAPNVYVSVLAVRGRIREVPWYSFFSWGWKEPLAWARAFWVEGRAYQAPTAMVDLSKPAFKFGVAALRVGTAAHELKVQVSTESPQTTIRSQVPAQIRVTGSDGKPVAGAEVAFAAVDESLLALKSNDTWDLLAGMIQERAWGVETSTAQSEIIGRRHYGRKAVAAGGGGGRGGARELFDTLLVWKPDIVTDARGEARIVVPVNDALTTFRLVAVADGGVQTFGTGQARLRVTQDLQVLAGLPPLVREGDRFQALVTLRNTTSRAMTVRATLAGTVNRPLPGGGPDFARAPLALPPQEVALPANGARELTWTVEVPANAFSIAWELGAEELGAAAGKGAQDKARHLQLVKEAVPVRVMQATLQQLDGPLALPVQAPADALAGGDGVRRGGLLVAAQPKLSSALPGLRRFFETYPYSCLEQQTSKAVGLSDPALWTRVANALPGYLDSDGLAAYFPPRTGDPPSGSDRLTAYVIATAHEAGYAIPEPALSTMLQGLAAFVQGRLERRFWSPQVDGEVRKLAALAALARYGRVDVRWLGAVRTTPDALGNWPTAALIDWLTVLQRVPTVPERAARLAEVQQALRARLVLGGTTLRFSTEATDFWWWLMDSADSNAARLIVAVMDDPAWRDDLPRLVTGHLARQQRGAWLTTTANAWSVLALEKFATRFESQRVAGRLQASSGGAPQAIDWAASPQGARVLVPWPAGAGTLRVTQEGSGKPWVTVQSLAAVPLTAPLRMGYGISRTVTAVEQKQSGSWSRGDVMRVRLEIEAMADMTWVVVQDPVPAGATILGSGLGRDSAIATSGERSGSSASSAYDERSFEAWRSYYAYLPKGKHTVEYTVRLNNPGRFALPPTRVEAMYAPESFGETPNAALEVKP